MTASALDSETGPRSAQESKILWNESRREFGIGNYGHSSALLKRFTDRYPADPNYREGLFLLGTSLIRSKNYKEAVPPLKAYIELAKKKSEANPAKLALARAHTELGTFSEAYLASSEVIGATTDVAELSEALLIKAWSQLKLGQWERAELTLESLKATLVKAPELVNLKSQSLVLSLDLLLDQCGLRAQKSTQTPAEENEVRHEITRQSECLIRAHISLKEVLENALIVDLPRAFSVIDAAYQTYRDRCQNPPPPRLKRSEVEKKRYAQELADALKKDCNRYRVNALELMGGPWTKPPPSLQSRKSLIEGWKNKLTEEI